MKTTGSRIRKIILSVAGVLGLALGAAEPAATSGPAARARPNVLIVMIDDCPFNFMDVYQKSHVHTPNIQRLVDRGTWFSRGYNDAPVCCASRTALLTGIHSTRSGVYYNNQAYRRASTFIAGVTNLPQLFMANGYLTIGYGKVAHNTYGADETVSFTPGYYKYLNNPADVTHTEEELLQHVIPGTLLKVPSPATDNWGGGVLPDDWDRDDPAKMQQDTEQANRTIAILREKHDQPFFMICGFYRPHGPWVAPERYYKKFPLDSIQLPEGYQAGDLEDLPKPGRWIATNRREHAAVIAAGMWKKLIQGISASTAYVDDQIGRVLDALEQGPNNRDTIVIFAGDNGFHTGEKDHWLKFALWEQTCRVPFAISIPGMPRQQVHTPVSLIDIFPTLLAQCGIAPPTTHEIDGVDLSGILAGRTAARGAPVLSTYGRGNHSLRNERYRLIHYRNGDEEFYDEQNDPHEFTNLAGDPRYAAARDELAKALPAIEAPDIAKPAPALKTATWEDEAFEK